MTAKEFVISRIPNAKADRSCKGYAIFDGEKQLTFPRQIHESWAWADLKRMLKSEETPCQS